MPSFDPAAFETMYPGVPLVKEARLFERYLADNRALETRGPIDVEALVAGTLPPDTPGIGAVLQVTEAMVRYNNAKWDPENPALNDAAYARSLGHPDIPAMPCYGACDDVFMVPYPPAARDTLLVSQLNHSVTSYKPVYPGDTLHLVCDRRHVVDRTPTEGSIYRHLAIRSEGSVYNQRAEKVNDVVYRVTESVKNYKDGLRPEKLSFAQVWEGPDWMSRPAHYYTDSDWDFIKSLWNKEKRQGSTPLYWEDVKVGDTPVWTVDGPIEESLAPANPYGLGIGGSRTMKQEILDPAVFATMVRGEKDGIYRLPRREDCVPPVPDGAVPFFMIDPRDAPDDAAVATQDIHRAGEDRGVLINTFGRNLAIRHLNNWMGDHGWLHNIRWGLMPPEGHAALGLSVPTDPDAEYFLGHVPHMNGIHELAHGLTGDLAIVKSYVHNKRVVDGDRLVELTWWIETIEGDIWFSGGATVRLPSRAAATGTHWAAR
jgi:hypothetical protein